MGRVRRNPSWAIDKAASFVQGEDIVPGSIWFLVGALGIATATYMHVSLWRCSIGWLIFLCLVSLFSKVTILSLIIVWALSAAVLVLLNSTLLRQKLITARLIPVFLKSLPRISTTERAALEAGDVWWESDLFRGNPDWNKWLKLETKKLTAEEHAFLDGPTETFCKMINDWDITAIHLDLRPEEWQFLKDNGFFGLIIPKKYGGKEFSALAHSEILAKVSACSVVACTIIGVPNSLGPAELLMHYGTEEQKNYYLPRLARGEEIPCFALTAPDAGSDAAAITDSGIICKHMFDGKEKLAIRLNFNKRYITLAPVATVIGLAFKLYDPEKLFSDKIALGITCALIPATTPGIEIGRRHFPLNIPFPNGPLHGHDVIIPLDWIIGGSDYVGQGWRMLMECLSIGRGITLPASSSGGARVAACATTAYARIRRQFNLPIGSFEGVQKVLARLCAKAYISESLRTLGANAVDLGLAPAVASGITKYHTTELSRQVSFDVMDVLGGKGICLGPRNFAGRSYQSIPIGITVEGANILTRNLIIFGQGALRCHPYLLKEVSALQETDKQKRLVEFDKVLFSHVAYSFGNFIRTLWLGVTSSLFLQVSASYRVKRYYQHLSRYSAALAFLSDVTLALFGGTIKRKENLSARLGDIFSFLYMGSAVLKRFQEQGEQKTDLPLVDWAMHDILFQIQDAFDQFLYNMRPTPVAWLLRFIVFPLGRHHKQPADYLEADIVKSMMQPGQMRDRLYGNAYIASDPQNIIGQLEKALHQVDIAAPLIKKLKATKELIQVPPLTLEEMILEATKLGIITKDEASFISEYNKLRWQLIAVDDFSNEELGAR